MSKQCSKCGAPAKWEKMSGVGDLRCHNCVPRDCVFCNTDDDGYPLPRKDWEPCAEWWPIIVGKEKPDASD